jgi:hypothetical protein
MTITFVNPITIGIETMHNCLTCRPKNFPYKLINRTKWDQISKPKYGLAKSYRWATIRCNAKYRN